jgi:phenylalanyl-tRNA synthetase beta chain
MVRLICLVCVGGFANSVADATFFHGHSASIHAKLEGKDQIVGEFGVLHPTVLKNYELP